MAVAPGAAVQAAERSRYLANLTLIATARPLHSPRSETSRPGRAEARDEDEHQVTGRTPTIGVSRAAGPHERPFSVGGRRARRTDADRQALRQHRRGREFHKPARGRGIAL